MLQKVKVSIAFITVSAKEDLSLLKKFEVNQVLEYEGDMVVFKIILSVAMYSLAMSPYLHNFIMISSLLIK